MTITRSAKAHTSDDNHKTDDDANGHGRVAQVGERLLRSAEDGVYVMVAVLLVVGAVVLLVDAAGELAGIGHGADTAVLALLDRLLLVFVLVELIFAVRMTLTRREIVAEPFLIVGIIASIKEIVVLSVKAAESIGSGQQFEDQLWEVAVLGVVVVLLGATAWLLRLKEREPSEGAQQG